MKEKKILRISKSGYYSDRPEKIEPLLPAGEELTTDNDPLPLLPPEVDDNNSE